MDNILEVPPGQSFNSSNLSARAENKLLDRIVKLGYGFLFPPIIITIFSFYAYFQILNKILLVCPLISIISFSASFALIHYAKQARDLNIRASNKMFYSLYLMHLCAVCYFFVGFFIMFLFEGEEMLSKVNFALLAIEGGGIKYLLGYTLLFLNVRKLTIEYQIISNYLQIMQLNLAICGVCVFFTSFCYQARWEHLDISYHVPSIMLSLGMIAGLSVIILTIITFIGSYLEKFPILLLSQVLSIILTIFLLMLTVMLYKSNEIYIQVIEENCDYLLKIIHKDLLQCNKYSSPPCTSNLLATAWDESGDEKCINSSCCWEITQEVVLNLQILMAWSLLTAVLLLLSWLAGQGLIKKIEKFGKSTEKTFEFRAIICLVFIYLITGTSWIGFIDTDVKLKRNSARVRVIGAEHLDHRMIPGDLCRFIRIDQELSENIQKVRVFTENGQIVPSEFNGKGKKIQESLKNLKYCPDYVRDYYEIQLELDHNSQ